MPRGGKRDGAGRPVEFVMTPARWKKVIRCVNRFGTRQDVADLLGIHLSTLDEIFIKAGMSWTEFFALHSADARMSLRAAQYDTAIKGNPTMQIWLGKQHLDQKDRQEIGFDKDKPVVFKLAMGKKLEKDPADGQGEEE